jgi:hypothetical protein
VQEVVNKDSEPIFNIKEDGGIFEDNKIKISVGEEIMVMDDGLQPFMFLSDKGTLVVQAQLPVPLDYFETGVNKYPGLPGTVISRDGGVSWNKWQPNKDQGEGPIFEGCAIEYGDRIIILDRLVVPSGEPDQIEGKYWISKDDWNTLEGPFTSIYYIPGIRTEPSCNDSGYPFTGQVHHRSLLELPDGDLLATFYGWFKEDDHLVPYQPGFKKMRVFLATSKDKGKTWSYLSTVAVDWRVGTEGFDEPVLVHLTQGKHKGRLICIMRTGRDLYSAYSDDMGLTWSKACTIDFKGIDIYKIKDWMNLFEEPDAVDLRGALVDPDLIEMQNGLLVCAFGARIPARHFALKPSHERNGNYIAFSFDQGASWSHIVQITSGEMTTNYMSVCEINPGELYLVYDLGIWEYVNPDWEKNRRIVGRKIKVEMR